MECWVFSCCRKTWSTGRLTSWSWSRAAPWSTTRRSSSASRSRRANKRPRLRKLRGKICISSMISLYFSHPFYTLHFVLPIPDIFHLSIFHSFISLFIILLSLLSFFLFYSLNVICELRMSSQGESSLYAPPL